MFLQRGKRRQKGKKDDLKQTNATDEAGSASTGGDDSAGNINPSVSVPVSVPVSARQKKKNAKEGADKLAKRTDNGPKQTNATDEAGSASTGGDDSFESRNSSFSARQKKKTVKEGADKLAKRNANGPKQTDAQTNATDEAGSASTGGDGSFEGRNTSFSARLKKKTVKEGADKVAQRKVSEELVLPPPQNVLQQIAAEEGQEQVREYVSEWGMAMSEEDITLATVANTVLSIASTAATRVAAHFETERVRVVTQKVVKAALLPMVLEVSRRVADEEQQANKVKEPVPAAKQGQSQVAKTAKTRRELFSRGSESDDDEISFQKSAPRPPPKATQARAESPGVTKGNTGDAKPVYSQARLDLPTAETIESNESRSSHSAAQSPTDTPEKNRQRDSPSDKAPPPQLPQSKSISPPQSTSPAVSASLPKSSSPPRSSSPPNVAFPPKAASPPMPASPPNATLPAKAAAPPKTTSPPKSSSPPVAASAPKPSPPSKVASPPTSSSSPPNPSSPPPPKPASPPKSSFPAKAAPAPKSSSPPKSASPPKTATPAKASPRQLNGSIGSLAACSPGVNQTVGMISTILDADSEGDIEEPSATLGMRTPNGAAAAGRLLNAAAKSGVTDSPAAKPPASRFSSQLNLSGQLGDDEDSRGSPRARARDLLTGRGRYKRAVSKAAHILHTHEVDQEFASSLLQRSVEPRVQASFAGNSDSDEADSMFPTQADIDAKEKKEQKLLKEVMKWRQVRQRVAAALSASDDDDIAAPQVRNGKVVVKERVVKERVVKEKVVKARVDAVFRGGPRQRAGSPGYSNMMSSSDEDVRTSARRQRAAIAKRVRRVSLSPDEERKLSLKHDAPSSDSESDFR